MLSNFLAITFAASCLLFTGCELVNKLVPEEATVKSENEFTTYLIPEKGHFTSNNFGIVPANKVKFLAKFDESAQYVTIDPFNQADINKLYGFSDCSTDHQSNSARFGWRWYNNQLEILAYTYVNQVRREKFITAVNLNQAYEYELAATDTTYVFKLNGRTVEMDRGCSGNSDKYKLFPYFGGDETAPHTIKIEIKEL